MTNTKDKEMIKLAQRYIKSMKVNASGEDKEMLDYIDGILQGYDKFKSSFNLEQYSDLSAENKMTIKFKTSDDFHFIEECMFYPWRNIAKL